MAAARSVSHSLCTKASHAAMQAEPAPFLNQPSSALDNFARGGDKYIATSWILFQRAEALFPPAQTASR